MLFLSHGVSWSTWLSLGRVEAVSECNSRDEYIPVDRSEELDHVEVTAEEIQEQINKLNTNKSPGLDDIHPRVLKEQKGEITELLAIICNP